jgi:hypothetical protein
MNQEDALDELGTAIHHLLESQLEQGSDSFRQAAAETIMANGQVKITIVLPQLSVVCTVRPTPEAEERELFRIEGVEGGPARSPRPRGNLDS